jgi:chemotaxis protein methyltransferase CheR
LVADEAGLDYARHDLGLVRRAVEQHLKALAATATAKITSIDGYLQYLRHHRPEFEVLIGLITINETRFFRNAHHFRALRDEVLPAIFSEPGRETILRLWSAGCATGEEPYSVALTLLDLPMPPQWRAEILGSDISPLALAEARRGIYHSRRLANVPQPLMQRHFDAAGPDTWRLDEAVRRLVSFSRLNLITETPPSPWPGNIDLILCENVLIYFTREVVEQVIGRFYDLLRPGGFLFLGYSETLWNIPHRFLVLPSRDAYYYRKPGGVSAVTLPAAKEMASPNLQRPAQRQQAMPTGATPTPARPPSRESAPTRPLSRPTGAAAPPPAPAPAPRPRLPIPDPAAHDTASLFARATTLADAHDVEGAVTVAQQLLARDPLHAPTYLLLSTLHLAKGNTDAAIADLRRAIYAAPASPSPHFRLGLIYSEANDPARAVHEFRNALQLLSRLPNDAMIEGFSKAVMTEACQRHIARLQR